MRLFSFTGNNKFGKKHVERKLFHTKDLQMIMVISVFSLNDMGSLKKIWRSNRCKEVFRRNLFLPGSDVSKTYDLTINVIHTSRGTKPKSEQIAKPEFFGDLEGEFLSNLGFGRYNLPKQMARLLSAPTLYTQHNNGI